MKVKGIFAVVEFYSSHDNPLSWEQNDPTGRLMSCAFSVHFGHTGFKFLNGHTVENAK